MKNDKPADPTRNARQSKRRAELQAAAERDGYPSASAALTAWKHGAARLVPVKRKRAAQAAERTER
jgi:hypothetical protein